MGGAKNFLVLKFLGGGPGSIRVSLRVPAVSRQPALRLADNRSAARQVGRQWQVGAGKSARLAEMSPISRKRLSATEQNSKTLRTHENQMGGALCTVCAYVRSARSTPTQMGRPLSAFPAHTRNHLAHGAKGQKWGFCGGGGMCGCVGYRGVLGCSDHNPASRSSQCKLPVNPTLVHDPTGLYCTFEIGC